MSDKTGIEWTDATWNPIRARNLKTGKVGWHCTHVSEGCRNCYAEGFNKRLGTGLDYKPGHERDIEIYLDEQTLQVPLRWRRPRKVFVCSMTDMFADFVKDEWISRMVRMMAEARQHTFQLLTKRPARALLAFEQLPAPLNVWLGVSVEDQAAADERIPLLLKIRATKRFLSCEPLLGPVDLRLMQRSYGFPQHIAAGGVAVGMPQGIHWTIAGGESGNGARPMHPDWARSLRDQCKAAGAPFFFKQWGEWIGGSIVKDATFAGGARLDVEGHGQSAVFMSSIVRDFGDGRGALKIGKKRAGRLLDGVEHSEFPEERP